MHLVHALEICIARTMNYLKTLKCIRMSRDAHTCVFNIRLRENFPFLVVFPSLLGIYCLVFLKRCAIQKQALASLRLAHVYVMPKIKIECKNWEMNEWAYAIKRNEKKKQKERKRKNSRGKMWCDVCCWRSTTLERLPIYMNLKWMRLCAVEIYFDYYFLVKNIILPMCSIRLSRRMREQEKWAFTLRRNYFTFIEIVYFSFFNEFFSWRGFSFAFLMVMNEKFPIVYIVPKRF